MRFFAGWLSICYWLVAGAIGLKAAGLPMWTLLADAHVDTELIHLSDLLPARTPQELRDAAEKISLGAAPPAGGTITLTGEKIAGLLSTAAREQIAIPSQVLVHRSGRWVTRAEVLVALQAALRSNPLPGISGMEPGEIRFSAPVQVAAEDARLEVRRIDFDPALKQARFLLASTADHRSLPFLAMAELQPTAHDTTSSDTPSLAANLAGDSRTGQLAEAVALVAPRKLAKLHVASSSMQMFLDVVPLERGALHETVRVRILGSGRVLRGRVMAPGALEAQF